MSQVAFSGRHHSYAPARSELTDEQIEQRFGDVIGLAMSSFIDDPSYLADMATTANQIQARRDQN